MQSLVPILVKIGKVGKPMNEYVIAARQNSNDPEKKPEVVYGSLLELLDALGLTDLMSESGVGDVIIDNKTYEYDNDGEILRYQFSPKQDYYYDTVYIEDIDIHEGSIIILR